MPLCSGRERKGEWTGSRRRGYAAAYESAVYGKSLCRFLPGGIRNHRFRGIPMPIFSFLGIGGIRNRRHGAIPMPIFGLFGTGRHMKARFSQNPYASPARDAAQIGIRNTLHREIPMPSPLIQRPKRHTKARFLPNPYAFAYEARFRRYTKSLLFVDPYAAGALYSCSGLLTIPLSERSRR